MMPATETTHLHAMIDGQLRPNGVADHALLARVAALPRTPFAPKGTELAALYLDQPLPLHGSRSLLPPRTSARLVQALGADDTSRVLVLGAGTGYEAALLAPLVGSLTACEDDAALQPLLRKNLKPYSNASVLPFAPNRVPASSEPFTHVLAAVPFAVLPAAVLGAVGEGGKIAGVRVAETGLPTALVQTRIGKSWLAETLFETAAGPVHPQLAAAEHFVF